MRLLASTLLLLLVTGCAIVPLDAYYGHGYSQRNDRNHYDGDRYHRDHRGYDDDYRRRTH